MENYDTSLNLQIGFDENKVRSDLNHLLTKLQSEAQLKISLSLDTGSMKNISKELSGGKEVSSFFSSVLQKAMSTIINKGIDSLFKSPDYPESGDKNLPGFFGLTYKRNPLKWRGSTICAM